ncbi:MAG: hypothetical protein V2B14_04060 [bacterium]
MKGDLIHLNRDLEPSLTEQEYKKLNHNLALLFQFKRVHSQKYTCYECSENCIFDVKNDLPDMVLYCKQGFLDEERKLDNNDLIRFKLDLKENLKVLAERNGINFNFQPKTNNIVLFGTKKINSKVYKLFYINRLIASNSFEQSHIFKLKSYYKPEEIAFIITPAEFILDNASEMFLKEHSCEIISLKNLIDNGLIINKIGITNNADIKRIAGLYELVIFNSKELYFQNKKFQLYPQPYKLLCFLAENAKTAKTRDECILNVWREDALYIGYDKNLSDTCSLIRQALKKAGVKEKIAKTLIITEHKCIKLNLDRSRILKF